MAAIVVEAGTNDHLVRAVPVVLNLEDLGLTHLEPEIRVTNYCLFPYKATWQFRNRTEMKCHA